MLNIAGTTIWGSQVGFSLDLTFPMVFFAAFALDFVWAKYTRYLADGIAFKASIWAAGTIVLSGVSQIGYTSNHWLLIPAALGCFCGTYIAVKRHKAS